MESQNNFKLAVAITGSIATGKSTIAQMIRDMGYLVIDADQVARTVVEAGSPGLRQVVALFGPQILNHNGTLNRQKLRSIITQNPTDRQRLENVLHPLIKEKTIIISSPYEEKGQLWFYEAALIFEKGRQDEFLEVWLANCTPEEQLRRLMLRDQCTQSQAQAIIDIQIPNQDKAKRADAIFDTSDLNRLRSDLQVELQRVESERKKDHHELS